MMLFGAKLELLRDSSEHWQRWVSSNDFNVRPHVVVSHYPIICPPGHPWAVSVHWEDGTLLTGFGPTFAEAKVNCVKLLSERSREVGRV